MLTSESYPDLGRLMGLERSPQVKLARGKVGRVLSRRPRATALDADGRSRDNANVAQPERRARNHGFSRESRGFGEVPERPIGPVSKNIRP